MTVLNTALNEFVRKYLIKNPGEDEKGLALTFAQEYKNALSSIIEQLLFFDKVSIKVYGENVGLVVLINELGIKQVLDLVDEGAIEFLLWTPVLTSLTTDDLIGKVNPIQSGNLNSAVHCEPSESIKMGLRSLKDQPDRRTRRDLERKVAKVYKMPKPEFVHNAADIITSAYGTNKLADAGLPKIKEVQWLDHDERFKLLKLGDEILESTILADLKYSSLGNYQYYNLSKQSFDSIRRASGVMNNVNEIYRIESLPDVKALVESGQINLKDLIRLRRQSVSKNFRSWLISASMGDSDYISKAYLDEIANHKGLLETNKGKFFKTLGMYGIGTALGAAVGGVPGSLYGASLSKLLEPVAELGLSFIDSYLLDGILKGWQPRYFIDEYEKLSSNYCKDQI